MVQTAQRSILQEIASARTVNFVEAGEIVTMIGQSILPVSERHAITTAVQNKLHGARAARSGLQINMYIQRYLTADDWTKLQNPSVPMSMKMSVVIGRMHGLGCMYPSEPTVVNCVMVILMAGTAGEQAISSVNFWGTLQHFKTQLRAHRGRVRPSHWGTVPVYPDDATTLQSNWPDVYAKAYHGNESPAPCRIDETALADLRRDSGSQNMRDRLAVAKLSGVVSKLTATSSQ